MDKLRSVPEGLGLPGAAGVDHQGASESAGRHSDASHPALRVASANLYYGSFQALRNVSVDVPPSSITAIIGPSGCGKSSLLRTFNRMNDLIPTARVSGLVELAGIDIYAPGIDVVEVRKHVGMVFQKPSPFPMSVFDNVAYGPRRHGVKNKRRVEEIVVHSLQQTALWQEVGNKLGESALQLSGGQQQRLCIARVLAVNPSVILMDEPASALDPIATLKIEDLLRDLAKTYTIVIVTHNMQQAARVSDQTAMMMMAQDRTGELVEFGTTDDIFTNPQDKRTQDYITGRLG